MSIRVAIVEDQELVRTGLRMILDAADRVLRTGIKACSVKAWPRSGQEQQGVFQPLMRTKAP